MDNYHNRNTNRNRNKVRIVINYQIIKKLWINYKISNKY